jgi:hypothetical protein
MKVFRVVSTTLLLFLLGTGVSVYAQDQRDDAKPQAQEEEKPRQEEAKPAKPEGDKSVKQEEKKDENDRRQEEKTSRQDESKTVQSDHRTEAENRKGGRIPDDKFRAHFGREHTFRIGHPTIVEGRPRFQYGGYSFVMVDPWPVGWAYTDVVYVDFIDGVYYLISPVHPGVQIVVNVVM